MTQAFSDTQEDDEVDADFLDFLAEVDEATGEGFETWLETETQTDKNLADPLTNDINNEPNNYEKFN